MLFRSRRLTDKTLTGGGSIATESYIDTAETSLTTEIDENQTAIASAQTDITYIRSRVDSIYTDTQHIRTQVDSILAKWGTNDADDIIADLDTVKTRIGTSADLSSVESLFGRTKFLQEKWGSQTAQAIYDAVGAASTTINEVQSELGYNGTGTTAYADLVLVKGYVDSIEGYLGTPADLASASTVFGRIKDAREKLDQLDDIEAKIDTIDTVVDNIFALQQAGTTSTLDEDTYDLLEEVSNDLSDLSGDKGYDFDDLYKISDTNSDDIKFIKNKTIELKALAEINRLLIDKVANEPVTTSWFEWGSVILKMLIVNPSNAQTQTIPFKYYLPHEAGPQHIIDQGDLEVDYDQDRKLWYVHRDIELEPGESVVKTVRLKDIWVISEEELESLRKQTLELIQPLENTDYFAQATTLKNDIERLLDGIIRKQKEYKASPEEHIVTYRENKESLSAVENNLKALNNLVAETSGKSGLVGSLFGVSTAMTWGIIIIVIVGISVLMILLYVLLRKSRALESYISPGETLKAPPIVDVKKHAEKMKGGFITYLLPPFGEPLVDTERLIKIIKVLLFIIILVALGYLGARFTVPAFLSSPGDNSIMEIADSQKVTITSDTAGSNYASTSEDNATQDIGSDFSETLAIPAETVEEKQTKLKITETGLGWLNVRSDPSLDSDILIKVYVNDEFIYTEEKTATATDGSQEIWYKITLEDESEGLPAEVSAKEGWVYGKYIEILSN